MVVVDAMFDGQQHLFNPIGQQLKDALDRRINNLIDTEIRNRGFAPYRSRQEYREKRLSTLKHYSDSMLLKLADSLSDQLVMRFVTHVPERGATSQDSTDANDD
jgi:hypothetical protein